MKTRYFRRKENCAAVEWIEMSGAEYLNFVRNPKNKDRFFLNMKNVVLECSKEEYLQNRAEKRRSDYLAEGKKDWTIISLFAQRDKESNGEEVVPDLETDVEEEIIHTITLQKLREALTALPKEDGHGDHGVAGAEAKRVHLWQYKLGHPAAHGKWQVPYQ